jgi:hypothetical protein
VSSSRVNERLTVHAARGAVLSIPPNRRREGRRVRWFCTPARVRP